MACQAQAFNFFLKAVPLVPVADHQEAERDAGFCPQLVDGFNHEVDVFLVRQPRHADENLLVGQPQFVAQGVNVGFFYRLKALVLDAGGLHKGGRGYPDHAQVFLGGVGGHNHPIAAVSETLDQRVRNQVAEQHAGQGHEVGIVLQPGVVGVDGRNAELAGHKQPQAAEPERMMQVNHIRPERPNLFANAGQEDIGQPELPFLAHGQQRGHANHCIFLVRLVAVFWRDNQGAVAQLLQPVAQSFDGNRHTANERQVVVGKHGHP